MNTSEFELFIEKYGNDVYHFCRFLTMQQELAEDLYQDTVLYAFEVCEKIDLQNNPKSFFLSIAVGKWKNYQRKRGRRSRIGGEQSLDELGEMGELVAAGTKTPDRILEKKEERSMFLLAAFVL